MSFRTVAWPLHKAVEEEKIELVSELISEGFSVNAKNDDGLAPLHLAISSNSIKMTELLLNHGADARATSEKYGTPMEQALDQRNVQMVDALIEASGDVKKVRGRVTKNTPLHVAASGVGHENLMKLLIGAGVDVDAKNSLDETPLHLACNQGSWKTVKLLIEAGADVNIMSGSQNTPLHCAVEDDCTKVKLLIEAGAELNVRNCLGDTPLHLVVDLGVLTFTNLVPSEDEPEDDDTREVLPPEDFKLFNVIRVLIKNGADVNVLNEDGETPYATLFDWLNDCGAAVDDNDYARRALRVMIECIDVNLDNKLGRNTLADILDSQVFRRELREYHKILVQHVAILRTLDLTVNNSLLDSISRVRILGEYYMSCMVELEKAKDTKIRNYWVPGTEEKVEIREEEFTFFELLIEDKSNLVKYAENQELVVDFRKRNLKKDFPIYGVVMKSNMRKGIKKRVLRDAARHALSDSLALVDPFHSVIRDTLDLLDKKDLRCLLSISKD